MKSKQDWDNSGVWLSKFIEPLDEIDEELYDYLLGVVPPQYKKYNLLQAGEIYMHIDSIPHYMTVMILNNKYYYLGILPEFKQ